MASSVNPRIFLFTIAAVVIVIGGVCFFLWNRNAGEGPPTETTADVNRPAMQPGNRGVVTQARSNLPAGVPRLIVPGPRR